MSKFLRTTSALALAMSSSAQAVEWDVHVGGYFETFAAYASPDVSGFIDEEYNGIDSKQDSEVHFLPTITLDNGLTIGADIQLEGFSGEDAIDESFLYVEGRFGRVLLGNSFSAGYLMTYAAPDVTFVNVNSGSMTAFVPYSGSVTGRVAGGDVQSLFVGNDIFYGTLGTTYLENDNDDSAQRFTFFTPRLAGFQIGLSYARDGEDNDNTQYNLDAPGPAFALHNVWDVGANYVNSFGDFDVAVSGRWGIAGSSVPREEFYGLGFGGDDPQIWSAGLNLGYAGFTIGGSFAEQNNTIARDGQAYDAGISYETGPWGFSFTYMHGRNTDNETVECDFAVPGFDPTVDCVANPFTGLGNIETLKQYLLGANYALAEGVALSAFGAYVDFDEDVGDNGGPNVLTGDDVDGWVVGTGIQISF